MNARHLSALVAVAGLLTLAACGDPDNPPVAEAPAQQRSLEDVTSNRPAKVYPAHGSPWYPTPAPETFEDPCLNRPHRVPKPC